MDSQLGVMSPHSRFPISLDIASYPGLQPPANRLPHELLARIFELGLADSTSPHHPSALARLRDALKLASVCRHWRAIALCVPALWSQISLFPTPPRTGILITRLGTQLERSSSASLHLTISFIGLRRAEQIAAFWNIIRPHLHRCEHLEVIGIRKAAARIIFPLAALERLGHLALQTESSFDLAHVFAPILPGEEDVAPRLTSMWLSGVLFTCMPIRHSLHTLFITARREEPQDLRGVIGVLRAWRGVVDLRVLELEGVRSIGGSDDDEHGQLEPVPPLELPNLDVLRFPHAGRIAIYLSVPNLRVLKCDGLGILPGSASSGPFQNVEHLALYDALHVSNHSLLPFPSVKTIILTGTTSVQTWLDAFSVGLKTFVDEADSSSLDGCTPIVPTYVPELEFVSIQNRGISRETTFGIFRALARLLVARPGLRVELVGLSWHFDRWGEATKEMTDRVTEVGF